MLVNHGATKQFKVSEQIDWEFGDLTTRPLLCMSKSKKIS